jgi:hypothetical protein
MILHRTTRTRILSLAALCCGLALPAGPANASTPSPALGCPVGSTVKSDNTAIVLGTTPLPDTKRLIFTGVPGVITDVDVFTRITALFSGNLEVTLTSPAGTTVTLTSGNGGLLQDVFGGTLWDDQAGVGGPSRAVTDAQFTDGQASSPLVPEQALAAFRGELPNGTWTLGVRGGGVPDVLGQVSLGIETSLANPAVTRRDHASHGSVAIPDSPGISVPGTPVRSTIDVHGPARASRTSTWWRRCRMPSQQIS